MTRSSTPAWHSGGHTAYRRALTSCSAMQVGRVRSGSSLNSLLPLLLIAYISFIPFCFEALAIEARISECWRHHQCCHCMRLHTALGAWSKVAGRASSHMMHTAVPASLAWPVLPSWKLVAVAACVRAEVCRAACSH